MSSNTNPFRNSLIQNVMNLTELVTASETETASPSESYNEVIVSQWQFKYEKSAAPSPRQYEQLHQRQSENLKDFTQCYYQHSKQQYSAVEARNPKCWRVT